MRKFGFKKFFDDIYEGYIIILYYNFKYFNYNFEEFYSRFNSKD